MNTQSDIIGDEASQHAIPPAPAVAVFSERMQLMIVGEAMSQASRIDEELAGRIENAREIINLRNVIVHGYAVIENQTIGGILQADVPKLGEQIDRLL